MKAIYINLDPYLEQFAAWLKSGGYDDEGNLTKPLPSFDPLPLAVTVPLGQTVGIVVPGGTIDGELSALSGYSVDDVVIGASLDPNESAMPDPPAGESVITNDFGPGYTAYPYDTICNSIFSVSGESATQTVYFFDVNDNPLGSITFTVIVRRETAQGPVDLVDFTPPAAAPSAADIKSALAAAGSGALAGVYLNGTKWPTDGADDPSSIYIVTPNPDDVAGGNDILAITNPGS